VKARTLRSARDPDELGRAEGDILGLANRLLPGPGGVGTTNTKGADSTSAMSPSLLTHLSDRAALANNELQVGNPA
jgi:hypothetical protein